MIQDSCQREFVVVGIGSSAGGPRALERLLGTLPGDTPATFILSQHMPDGFTRSFAERLSSDSSSPVTAAYHGCMAKAGEALTCTRWT